MKANTYTVKADVWVYPGKAAWYFVTIPRKQSEEIKEKFSFIKRGWGSLPVTITIGDVAWDTSIFPDKREGAYLLPLKASMRKKAGIKRGEDIVFSLKIRA